MTYYDWKQCAVILVLYRYEHSNDGKILVKKYETSFFDVQIFGYYVKNAFIIGFFDNYFFLIIQQIK